MATFDAMRRPWRRRFGAAAAGLAAAWLAAVAGGAGAADAPEWVARVPDFRSSWPEPLAIGADAPDFTLEDVVSGKKVHLAKAREGKRATLLVFLDDNCGTCKRRGTDLAATMAAAQKVDGALVLPIFVSNLVKSGAKGALAFAEKAGLPPGPILHDDREGRAETALAYRVTVAPCVAVLDAGGKLRYFGMALPQQAGSDLVPPIVAQVAEGKPVDGAPVRPPFG